MVVPERIMIPWRSLSTGDSRSRLAISGGRLARVLAQPARTPNQAVQHSRPAARVRGKGGAAPDLAAPPSTRARQLGVHENAGSGVLSRLCAFGVTVPTSSCSSPRSSTREAGDTTAVGTRASAFPSRGGDRTRNSASQIPIVMRQVSTSTQLQRRQQKAQRKQE